MHSQSLSSVLEKHVPEGAVDYCLQLWREYPFHFILRKSRVSKLGDFSCRPGREPRITVNADSHPYVFLITYVHEVAHLRVHRDRGWKAAPHGKEWKMAFQQLFEPLLNARIFPDNVEQALRKHMENPRASSFADATLTRVLRQYDERSVSSIALSDLPEGSTFHVRGRWFEKGKLRRTRVLCRELSSRRNYLIAADTLIGNPD